MTYSIVARCPHTGRLGVGTATFSIACGRRNESVRANVGISKSQAFYDRATDPLVLNLLKQGFSPACILETLRAGDPDFEYRQIGIVDRGGAIAVHTGSQIGQWAGHHVGPYYVTFGNGLAGPRVVEGIAAGFLSEPDADLEYRLLLAVEGGRDAGGQASNGVPRPERSAWICVIDRMEQPEIDIRVDLHAKAVSQLRHVFETCQRERDAQPGSASATRSTKPARTAPQAR
jgi:uncharacterized Ntn-hydrolase superfamily protein